MWILIFSVISALIIPTTTVQTDINILSNRWTKGIVVNHQSVDPPKPSRGGWTTLEIEKEGKVKYADPFSCGFGLYKLGKWSYEETSNELTFHFSDLKGQMNNKKDEKIDETISYNILHLSSYTLILKPTDPKDTDSIGYLIMP